MEQMDQNLMEEKRADYQVYEVEGSHHQIGLMTAQKSLKYHIPVQQLSEQQKTYAIKCRELVKEIYPEISDEFRGYAEGLGFAEDDMLWHYSIGAHGGCSEIALKTPQGMIVGRNYDYYYFENLRHLIYTRPDKGLAHIGIHEGLAGGRFEGLNEKGLFVGFNGAGQGTSPLPVGISFHLMVRYLLERVSTAREARDLLLTLPTIDSKSYLVADKDEAYVVEVHPERREYREMEDNLLVMTNHFINPVMEEYCKPWANSVSRYERLVNGGKEILDRSVDQEKDLQILLTDHTAPLCGHNDGLATFWSCTANLEKREIVYSLGAPCRNPYELYYTFQK